MCRRSDGAAARRSAHARVLRDRLHDVQWAVADAVVAEDEQHREQLREWLQGREDERLRWARELHDETLQQLGALQVLLTSGPGFAREALRLGARGYLLKEAAADELTIAIRCVLRGETYLHPTIGARLATLDFAPAELSDREIQVLGLIAAGYTNAEIAQRLYVSVRTVEGHRAGQSRGIHSSRPRHLMVAVDASRVGAQTRCGCSRPGQCRPGYAAAGTPWSRASPASRPVRGSGRC
jgi:DNA-binding NarL/FixJ family response regulator